MSACGSGSLLQFTRADLMIEEGVHADYREVWERVGPGSHDRAAFSLQVEYPLGGIPRRRAGVLVLVGEYFMFALDRLAALPAGDDLGAVMRRADLDAAVREQLLACEISLGRRSGPRAWEILHSTLPGHEGRSLIELHGAWTQTAPRIYQQCEPHAQVRRVWRQVERGARLQAF